MPLTDVKIRQAKPGEKPIKLTDGHGLYLEVRPNGTKLWRYRYRIVGKENLYAIGEYPDVGLQEARQQREQARALVEQGVHPSHQRKTERLVQQLAIGNTFEAVAREWEAKNKANWSATYQLQYRRFMEGDVYPYIGKLPVGQVKAIHILEIMQRVEKRGAETVALLIRQWCSAVFRFATITLRAESDPAAALRGVVVRPTVRHHPPLAREEIPQFLEQLGKYGGYRVTVIAIRLLMLTFVRTAELRKAKWPEFDLDAGEWRISGHRMKMGRPHLVPLSRQAVALLRELQTYTGGQELLFPNMRRPTDCMTITTINRALERMGYGGRFSGHGFRSTASTMLNEMGYREDLIERQLAHQPLNKVRASYNHAEYLEERRAMMQAWADWLDGINLNTAHYWNSITHTHGLASQEPGP